MIRSNLYWLGIGLAVIVAAALRVPGMFDDFWLDEIWSLFLVELVDSPSEIFTYLRHDNNHWLHSLFLYALGDQPWPVYRIPSLLAGSASVVLAGLIGGRRGRLEGFLSVVLVGACYLLIHYSSEARGYALAVFFALGCFYLLQRQAASYRGFQAVLFSASVVLGSLSHLSFVWAYLGTLGWSLFTYKEERRIAKKHAVSVFLAHHTVPAAGYLALYFVSVRHLVVGGGEPRPLWPVYQETIVWSLGAPNNLVGVILALLLLAAALVNELWTNSDCPGETLAYAIVIVVPFIVTLIYQPWFFYARYFIVSVPFALLILARFLARCWRGSRTGQALTLAVLAFFLAGNLREMLAFWQEGRGHFREAVRYVCEQTPGDDVMLDDVMQLGMTFKYYAIKERIPKAILRFTKKEPGDRVPDWLVSIHSFEPAEPPPAFVERYGKKYIADRVFRHYGLSGQTWTVYRARD